MGGDAIIPHRRPLSTVAFRKQQENCKVPGTVILSAAKNLRAAAQALRTNEILRCAQNDRSHDVVQNCHFAILLP